MKKTVALMLALALLLGYAALAEAGNAPILFRDIPWGSSWTEINEILPLKDLLAVSDEFGVAFRVYRGEKQEWGSEVSRYCTCESPERIEVAGYMLSDMKLNFARLPGPDGLLTDDPADTALFYASYTFDYTEDALEDLTDKMTRIYGEADPSHEGRLLWRGAEGTMVSLSASHPYIFISYGVEDAEQFFRSAQAALKYELSQKIDGL